MGLLSAKLEESVIKEAELARENALATNDAALLASLLSEKLVFVHSSGTVDERNSLLDKIMTGCVLYQSICLQPYKILPLGSDTWALWGKMDAQIIVAGTQRHITSSYVTVWVLETDGVLRLALHQATSLTN